MVDEVIPGKTWANKAVHFWLWGRDSFGVLGGLVDPLALGVGAKELCSRDIFVTGATSVDRPLQTCSECKGVFHVTFYSVLLICRCLV